MPRRWTFTDFDHKEIPPTITPNNHPFGLLGTSEIPIEISDDEDVVKMEPLEFMDMGTMFHQAAGTIGRGGDNPPDQSTTIQSSSSAAQPAFYSSQSAPAATFTTHGVARAPPGIFAPRVSAPFQGTSTNALSPTTTPSIPSTTHRDSNNTSSVGAPNLATPYQLVKFGEIPPFAKFRGFGLLEQVIVHIICSFLSHLALTERLVSLVTEMSLGKLTQLFPMYRKSCGMKNILPSSEWQLKRFDRCKDLQLGLSPVLDKPSFRNDYDLRVHVQSCIDKLTWNEFGENGFDALVQQKQLGGPVEGKHFGAELGLGVLALDPDEADGGQRGVNGSEDKHVRHGQRFKTVVQQATSPEKHRLDEEEKDEDHRPKRRMLNEALSHFRPAATAVKVPDIHATVAPDPDTTVVDSFEMNHLWPASEADESALESEDEHTSDPDDSVIHDDHPIEETAAASVGSNDTADDTDFVDTTTDFHDTPGFIEAHSDSSDTTERVSECFSPSSSTSTPTDTTATTDTSDFSDKQSEVEPTTVDTPKATIQQVTELLQTPLPTAGTENLDFWLCLIPILTVTYTAMLY